MMSPEEWNPSTHSVGEARKRGPHEPVGPNGHSSPAAWSWPKSYCTEAGFITEHMP